MAFVDLQSKVNVVETVMQQSSSPHVMDCLYTMRQKTFFTIPCENLFHNSFPP